MELGVFTKKSNGEYVGTIKTIAAVVEGVRVTPLAPGERLTDNSPDYRVRSATGSDFGAGWNRTSSSGQPYVSLVLHDPSFNNGQKMYPALLPRKDGTFVMLWDQPDPNMASEPSPEPARPASADMPGAKAAAKAGRRGPAPAEGE